MKRPIEERLKELESQDLSREEVLTVLYLERYPMFEITKILGMESSELKEVSENLGLFLLRCPIGHKFRSDPALHGEDAHYCVECQRWFNEATLNDEIELEIRRLKEKEPANQI